MLKLQITKWILPIISIFVLIGLLGCSAIDDGDTTDTPVDTDVEITEVFVTANPDSINFNETSTISVAVYNASGAGASGQPVTFALDRPSLASISPSFANTNSAGVATATLTSRNLQGDVSITATAGGTTSDARVVSVLSGVTAATINLTSNPTTILTNGTATVTAEVLDEEGNAVPDGTSVLFTVSNDVFGSMSTASATTTNGFATSTFEADTTPGTVEINASSGGAAGSAEILINQTQPASLEFLEADPQLIAIAGSGGVETSHIRFAVNDENGIPLSGISVSMTMEGPGGGEYIDNDGTPLEIDVSSNAEGIAEVLLRSGTTPGPVTILAEITVNGVPFRARSSVVSIGGGVPSAGRFSVAATVLNVPGLNKNNLTTDITAYMADRFGNYNILAGTTVTFICEPALAIDTQDATVTEDGLATVTARTQHPVINPIPGGYHVEPFQWEVDLLDYLLTDYGVISDSWPRNGLVSVLVITDGEEEFDDLNANGLYDIGTDVFSPYDTADDPYIDYNDNNTYTVDNPYDPSVGRNVDPDEIFIDPVYTPTVGIWDDINGVWDSDKKIFHNFKILITGEPDVIVEPSAYGFDVPDRGFISFKYIVADRNLNYPSAGTSISVAGENVEVIAQEVTMQDSSYLPGPTAALGAFINLIEYTVTLQDPNFEELKTQAAKATITVVWEGITKIYPVGGTSN